MKQLNQIKTQNSTTNHNQLQIDTNNSQSNKYILQEKDNINLPMYKEKHS